jgi:TRAP-type mannitol/chloroaromatic compound transport system substrate-binding protein
MTPWEEKATGLFDYLDKLIMKKPTPISGSQRHWAWLPICLTKPSKPSIDLKGMNMRGNPTTVQIVKALGANPVQMARAKCTGPGTQCCPGDITPAFMLRTLGLDKVTNIHRFPGFFDGTNVLVVNLDKWKALPTHLQNLITEQATFTPVILSLITRNLEKQELDFLQIGRHAVH